MKETIIKDDLVFHFAHGLCRVADIIRATRSKEVSYSLLPVPSNAGKMRFFIPGSSLEDSGFSKLITVREANAILKYFKTVRGKTPGSGQAWALAVMIREESCRADSVKDTKKRQRLEQSVRGLAGELAFVLQFSLREIAERIRKNLKTISEINPLVLAALANVGRD